MLHSVHSKLGVREACHLHWHHHWEHTHWLILAVASLLLHLHLVEDQLLLVLLDGLLLHVDYLLSLLLHLLGGQRFTIGLGRWQHAWLLKGHHVSWVKSHWLLWEASEHLILLLLDRCLDFFLMGFFDRLLYWLRFLVDCLFFFNNFFSNVVDWLVMLRSCLMGDLFGLLVFRV